MSEHILVLDLQLHTLKNKKCGYLSICLDLHIYWAFTYSSLQIACTVDDFLLLLYFKLFHLLLLQRGQATTRVVYNIKFMTRWDFSWTSFVMGMQCENMSTTYIKQRFGWWCTSYFFLADVIQEQQQMLNNLRMAYPPSF